MKKMKAPLNSVMCALVSIMSAAGQAELQLQTAPAKIKLHSGRPIADALDELQKQLLRPITYEEVPYENELDLKRTVVMDAGRERIFKGPPVVDFSVTFSTKDSSAYVAAQTVLTTYRNAALPGEYEVVQASGRIDVLPSQVLGRSGAMHSISPLMSRSIEFPLANRPVRDVLGLLVDQVANKSGRKVILLDPLFWPTDRVELESTGQSAADVISAIGVKLGIPTSFRCLYDATDDTYYLRIQGVTASNPASAPTKQANTQTTPVSNQGNSPWFVKK